MALPASPVQGIVAEIQLTKIALSWLICGKKSFMVFGFCKTLGDWVGQNVASG